MTRAEGLKRLQVRWRIIGITAVIGFISGGMWNSYTVGQLEFNTKVSLLVATTQCVLTIGGFFLMLLAIKRLCVITEQLQRHDHKVIPFRKR